MILAQLEAGYGPHLDRRAQEPACVEVPQSDPSVATPANQDLAVIREPEGWWRWSRPGGSLTRGSDRLEAFARQLPRGQVPDLGIAVLIEGREQLVLGGGNQTARQDPGRQRFRGDQTR